MGNKRDRKSGKTDPTLESGPLVKSNEDSAAQDGPNEGNRSMDTSTHDASHVEAVENDDELVDGVSLDREQVYQPAWDLTAIEDDIRDNTELVHKALFKLDTTEDIVKNIRDKVESSDATDLVRDVLDRLESPGNMKIQEVAPLIIPELKKLGKTLAKTGEEVQTANSKYEALVTKTMTIAQDQHNGLASTIVRSIQNDMDSSIDRKMESGLQAMRAEMAAILEPFKAEMSRIDAYIAGFTRHRQRSLPGEDDKDKSNSLSNAYCAFCEKQGHPAEECRTVATASARHDAAKTKSLCTKCLVKYTDVGLGHVDCSRGNTICSLCSPIMSDTSSCGHHEALCNVKRSALPRKRQETSFARAPKVPRYSLDNRPPAGPSKQTPHNTKVWKSNRK